MNQLIVSACLLYTSIEKEIKTIMDEINSPILSIPGISYRMGAMIIAEIGDFSQFDSPDKDVYKRQALDRRKRIK